MRPPSALRAAPYTTAMSTDLVAAAARPTGLTAEEAQQALDAITGARLTVEQGADLLVAMRQRGETAVELSTFVRGLVAKALPVDLGRPVMDVVGTGGSGRARYNASTTACFVLAAAGVPVAKHGNRGSNHANGSFDLLEALGIPFQPAAGGHRRLIDDTGLCFIFARQAHPAIGAAAPFRKLAAARVPGTIFNLAGPLSNPARPASLLMGCARTAQGPLLADTLRLLGTRRSLVACGHPGIDEVSVTGPTSVWEVTAQGATASELPAPAEPAPETAVTGGDCTANAATFHRLLGGVERGPLLEFVAANAGTALAIWRGLPAQDAACRAEAREIIVSGRAKAAFERHRSAARLLAGLAD
ncbi:MAG: anthranilate phosphoribosyltransferase [Planctomycetes bacterium]|nr:anthranilate phosphoribosyltransferase [Planctomycetota bacterium]